MGVNLRTVCIIVARLAHEKPTRPSASREVGGITRQEIKFEPRAACSRVSTLKRGNDTLDGRAT